jgi:cellulose synthase/poly-beta-1,6-N-acetylglucosamine synthase-like glycosyltransferase
MICSAPVSNGAELPRKNDSCDHDECAHSCMLVSIIIRTYNEERYLGRLLVAIAEQDRGGAAHSVGDLQVETIVVDSGSTDRTIEIAQSHGASIWHISSEQFSFGRSLNLGCERAAGDVLVFISGHCIPLLRTWLRTLIEPIVTGKVVLAYGRQVGGETTSLSESEVFSKLYPERSAVPQTGFFCNNANAALGSAIWRQYRFDEALLGLEDMHLAKRLVESGLRIGYVAEAPVAHYHHETWAQVRRRYEREAIALQRIRPEWHVTFLDFLRFFVAGVMLDSARGLQERRWLRTVPHVVMFRLMQYWGAFSGNHGHRQLAEREKRRYFYPK